MKIIAFVLLALFCTSCSINRHLDPRRDHRYVVATYYEDGKTTSSMIDYVGPAPFLVEPKAEVTEISSNDEGTTISKTLRLGADSENARGFMERTLDFLAGVIAGLIGGGI